MNHKSYRIALGGVTAALALVIMFLTGLGPFLTYVCPMFAGVLMVMIMDQTGEKWAYVTYASIGLLSLFITPDKEAAMLFIFLFGYYPIAKMRLDKIKLVIPRILLKLVVFNISVIVCYWLIMNVFGMGDVLDSLGDFGKYGQWIFLGISNLVFLMYDFFLTQATTVYTKWFRPGFIDKLKK